MLWISIFILSGALSCSKSSQNASNSQGQLFIKLIDAPAAIQQVNIVIDLVWIHRADADANVGWSIASSDRFGPVNLLNLRNGISQTLLLNTVPAGNYDQIKLKFGPCTVMKDGVESPLNISTGPPFEYILNYGFEVLTGSQAQLTFDFNISRSLSNNFFTPQIRVQNTSLSGWIVGSVNDTISKEGIPSSISTWTGLDSVTTLNDTITGSFQLSALPENLYSLWIIPNDSTHYQPVRIDSITVTKQMPTNIGIVFLKRR